MNVFIKNLPGQMTETQADKYFKPHLKKFAIRTYHCEMLKSQGCAILTILDISKAEKFLYTHGQSRAGPKAFQAVRQKLFHLNSPVYCSPSNKPPDRYFISSLEKQAKDQQNRSAEVKQNQSGSKLFEISGVWCGIWDYVENNLAFADYYHSARMGHIVFASQGLFITLDATSNENRPKNFLEIPYKIVNSIVVGTMQDPTITLSLIEPPRMFESTKSLDCGSTEDLNDMLARILLTNTKQQSPIGRKRICQLDKAHTKVVSSCLCYRFRIRNPAETTRMKKLKQLVGLGSITLVTSIFAPTPLAIQMAILNKALSDSSTPFELSFQLQKLAQNGALSPLRVYELLNAINEERTDSNSRAFTHAVHQLYGQLPFAGPATDDYDFAVDSLMENLRKKSQHTSDGDIEENDNTILVHKAFVTPTRIYLDGPAPEVKNRVLRKYAAFSSYFLSVAFTDEDGEAFRFDRKTSMHVIYDERFMKVLRDNIAIGGRLFQFLGFSHSSLRAHTCWYMAPFMWHGSLINAPEVIKDLGNFSHIRSPAKCAARIGQAFSQTLTSVSIPRFAIHHIKDIERNGRTFSDGVGTCSLEMLHKVWDGYSANRGQLKPTILQIRFQGAKGVVSLDSRLEGLMLCLRPSMIKFDGSDATDIEICGSAVRPLPMYLNRQIIKLLEDLGVKNESFLGLQSEAVEKLRASTRSAENSAQFLHHHRVGSVARLPWLIRKLWSLGLQSQDDFLLRNTLETVVLAELRSLKHKARILVEKGVTLYGIMDETATLREGQIYCSIHSSSGSEIITGNVVITRSPALHPGDIQIVEAVDVPPSCALTDLHNVVVFSSEGGRDLPSQLSGGDLDGDLYNVIYDVDLYPQRVSDAADYALVPPVDIGREVRKEDITDHFRLFMQNDNLGMIATLHQIMADQEDLGTFSPPCILLADLHSDAVDFSKTGIPVKSTSIPRYPKARPDFLAPGPQVLIENSIRFKATEYSLDTEQDDELAEAESYQPPKIWYYPSKKVLGQLYRAIDEVKFLEQIQEQTKSSSGHNQNVLGEVWNHVRKNTLLIQWEHHIDTAKEIKESYEENIIDTMTTYSPHPSHFISEVEVFAGCILGKNGAQSRRQREYSASMKDKHNRDVEYTIRCIMQGDEYGSNDEALERSIACLYVSLTNERPRPKIGVLVSFAWVAASVCLQEVEKFLAPM